MGAAPPSADSSPALVSSSPPAPVVATSASPPIVAWSVPDGCPDARRVEERARRLANVDDAAWQSAGSVRGRIVAEEGDLAGEWTLSLQIERSSGAPAASPAAAADSALSPARVFHASDCGALVEAAAVAIALALGGAEPAPAPETPELSEIEPALPERDGAADDAGPALTSRLGSLGAVARAEALLDTASLGGAALGGAAEVGVRWRAMGIRAYGLGLPSRQIRLAQEQSVELSLWAAGLRGCYRAADGFPQVDVCGGAEVGAFGAAGRNLTDAQVRRDVWAAATWGALLGVELAEHLQAGLRLEAVLPLSRERYLVNQSELVHEMSAASVRLALSLGGTLGSD